MSRTDVSKLSDKALEVHLLQAVTRERESIVETLTYLAEVDRRKLHLPAGYPSLYRYCLGRLHLSEGAAFRRIRAARAVRRCPAILEALSDGRLHLSAVVVMAPILTRQNGESLIAESTHKSMADVERIVAEWAPKLHGPTGIHALPARPTGLHFGPPATAAAAPARPVHPDLTEVQEWSSKLTAPSVGLSAPAVPEFLAVPTAPALPHSVDPPTRTRIEALSPGRFALHVTIERDVHDLLRRAQDLLAHQLPDGDVAEVIRRSLRVLVQTLEKRKFAATSQPRLARGSGSANPRHIPAHVRRAVWRRDQGQCTFVADEGQRCEARSMLEFDHVEPVAFGGQATIEGIRLRCRAHNQFAAEQTFGRDFMHAKRKPPTGCTTPRA